MLSLALLFLRLLGVLVFKAVVVPIWGMWSDKPLWASVTGQRGNLRNASILRFSPALLRAQMSWWPHLCYSQSFLLGKRYLETSE